MIWKWFKVYDLNLMIKAGVPTIEARVLLDEIGLKEFRVGYDEAHDLFNVVIDETVLTPNLNNRNGFNFKRRSAYIDADLHLWLGFRNEN